MAYRGSKQYGGSFICPSCGLPRKRKKYPKESTCRWCRRSKRRVNSVGYVHLWNPDHPLAMKDGYVAEHRFVLHGAGTDIPQGAHVHHLNGDKQDNRLENLAVLTPKQHVDAHLPEGSPVPGVKGVRWRMQPYVCPTCGNEYRPHVRTQVYCSRKCVTMVKNQYGEFPRWRE